jgi:hypothetical protein
MYRLHRIIRLRAAALSPDGSLALIRKVMEEYTDGIHR